ncbi:MAG: hypothetical protein P1V51_12015 [Deltaproteobacteria bacterium]|nr:hypothetical protein [Deltaproteobacteria bacterium]
MRPLLPLLLALLAAGPASRGLALSGISEGEALPVMKLRARQGKPRPYLEAGKVTAFVFFRPGQEFSVEGLRELAGIQERLKEAPVSWVGIVSDWYPAAKVSALVKETGFQGTVLVDEGDRLYGRLGVAVHPTTGIADAAGVLRAALPFRKVNYGNIVAAHLRHTLGELDDAGLQAALEPPKSVEGGDTVKARRNLKMGEMLFKMKKHEKALEIAQKSLEIDPELAEAHGLAAAIHAASGDCAKATAAAKRALELKADEARALEASAACGEAPADAPVDASGTAVPGGAEDQVEAGAPPAAR